MTTTIIATRITKLPTITFINTQHSEIHHNETQLNDDQHRDAQHKKTQYNDTQHDDTRHNLKTHYNMLSVTIRSQISQLKLLSDMNLCGILLSAVVPIGRG